MYPRFDTYRGFGGPIYSLYTANRHNFEERLAEARRYQADLEKTIEQLIAKKQKSFARGDRRKQNAQ